MNGKRIVGRQEIRPWQKIRFADVEAEVVDTKSRKPTTVMQAINDSDLSASYRSGSEKVKWKLKGITSPVAGKSFVIKDKTIMGRDARCEIEISSSMVSRNHAELFFRGNVLMIRDLGSTNGTYVNGVRISKEMSLQNGDEVKLDEVSFEVVGPQDEMAKTTLRPAVVDVSKTTVRPSIEKTSISSANKIAIM